MTEEPAKRLFQVTGIPFFVQTGGHPVAPIGSVHVVLDIFLAGPDDLDSPVDMLSAIWTARTTPLSIVR